MKKHTKEEIEGARNYFKKQRFQEVEVNLGSRTFSYFVLPQSLAPELPNFVFRATGDPENGYVLGISDGVDEKFREYAVIHEYIEFVEIGIDTPNACTKALDEELKLVPEDIKPDYIRMRAKFFRDLIPYCLKNPKEYPKDDINQFKSNLARLEEKV